MILNLFSGSKESCSVLLFIYIRIVLSLPTHLFKCLKDSSLACARKGGIQSCFFLLLPPLPPPSSMYPPSFFFPPWFIFFFRLVSFFMSLPKLGKVYKYHQLLQYNHTHRKSWLVTLTFSLSCSTDWVTSISHSTFVLSRSVETFPLISKEILLYKVELFRENIAWCNNFPLSFQRDYHHKWLSKPKLFTSC